MNKENNFSLLLNGMLFYKWYEINYYMVIWKYFLAKWFKNILVGNLYFFISKILPNEEILYSSLYSFLFQLITQLRHLLNGISL